MPQIYQYFGFVFFFYSNEHTPIHIHVSHSGCHSIFEIIMLDANYQKSVSVRKQEKNLFLQKTRKWQRNLLENTTRIS